MFHSQGYTFDMRTYPRAALVVLALLGLTAVAPMVFDEWKPYEFHRTVQFDDTVARGKTTATALTTSATTAATTSSTVAAFTFKALNALSGDLLVDLQSSAAAHAFTVTDTGASVSLLTAKGTTGLIAGASGTAITNSYGSGSLTLDLGTTTSSCSVTAEQTVTGAAVGDVCVVGPNATAGALGGSWSCYVSSAGKAVVKFCNPTAGAIDPASGAFYVRTFSQQ